MEESGTKVPIWRRRPALTVVAIALAVVFAGSFFGAVRKPPQYSSGPDAPNTAEQLKSVGVTKPGDSVVDNVFSANRDWLAGRVNADQKIEQAAKAVPQIYVFLKYVKFRVVYARDANGQFVLERNAAGDLIATTYGRPMLKIKKIVPYTQWYIASGSGTVIYSGVDPYRGGVGPRYQSLVITANHVVSPIQFFMKPLPTFLQDPQGRDTAYVWEMEILYDWRIEGNLNGIWFPLELPGVERPNAGESLKRLNEAMKDLGVMADGYRRGIFTPIPVVRTSIGKLSIDTGLPPALQGQLRGLPYQPVVPDALSKVDPRQLEMPGSAPELDIAVLVAKDKVFPKDVVFPFGFGRADPGTLRRGADVWLLGYPSGLTFTANTGKVNGWLSFGSPPWVNLVKLDVSSTGGFSGGPVLAVDQGFKFVGLLLGGLVNVSYTRVPDPELPEFYDPITGLPGRFPDSPFFRLPGEPRNEDLSWEQISIPIPGFSMMRPVDDIVDWMNFNGYDYVFGGKR